MVLSESDYGHQALSDIVPLRDIFGLLFFTSVGMLLDPAFLYANLRRILFLVLAVAIFKTLTFASLCRIFKYVHIVPMAVGLGLFQVGEFSFVLARSGLESRAIDHTLYALILSVSVISMMISPAVSYLAVPLYRLKKKLVHEKPQMVNIREEGLKNHTIIAGGGRVGQHVAQVLTRLSTPFVIVELNHQRITECKNTGYPAVFGDISQDEVLDASGLKNAALLLITTPSDLITRSIIVKARRTRPDLKIVARSEGVEQAHDLYRQGVYMAVLPELEAGLEIARQALLHLDVPIAIIQDYTDAVRQTVYETEEECCSSGKILDNLNHFKSMMEISWIPISADSPLVGQTLENAAVRTHTGATIVGILRKGRMDTNPPANATFEPDDLLAVVGNKTQRESFTTFSKKQPAV
jgi:CPA2 family monovalent cation:H+ antiporter-2